jgi:hypothetical protein
MKQLTSTLLIYRTFACVRVPAALIMEGIVCSEVGALPRLSPERLRLILASEPSSNLTLTKSILNLLYNIVHVQSIRPSGGQKRVLEEHEELVWSLLDKRLPLHIKRQLLAEHVTLVIAIAESCPL